GLTAGGAAAGNRSGAAVELSKGP
ncbi:hypothetical protein A2U01_0113479, partial [Trifolium medium]|nr:hypothetical protein [Trifolium medium]